MRLFAALTLLTIPAIMLAQSGNEFLAGVLALTETERNQSFAEVIESTEDNYACQRVTHSFVRGTDSAGNVYVAVRCEGGEDYNLSLSVSRSGVMPCKLLKVVAQLDCWKPL